MLIFSSLGLSLIDTMLMEVICAIIVFLIFFIISVNFLQEHHEKKLPRVLRDWKFLPKPLRTLETIDYVVQTYMEVCSLHRKNDLDDLFEGLLLLLRAEDSGGGACDRLQRSQERLPVWDQPERGPAHGGGQDRQNTCLNSPLRI